MLSQHISKVSKNDIYTSADSQLRSNSLSVLEFRDNQLNYMWSDGNYMYIELFENFSNLSHLYLSGNRLAFMSHDVFDHLPPLLELVLSGNQLRNFNWGRLYLLGWMELLALGSNLLTMVPRMLSNCTQTLRIFNLTRNQISKLTKDFLRDVTSLQYLDLSYNNLKTIQASSFPDSAIKHLRELQLSGNHFLCTCDARWFMWWNNQTTVYIPRLVTDVTCASPKAHRVVMVDLHSCELDYLGIGLYTFSALITLLLLVTSIHVMIFPHVGSRCWLKSNSGEELGTSQK